MDGFLLRIVTPDGKEFEGEAESLIVRSVSGDVCILKNHAEFVTTIDVSLVRIRFNGKEKVAACSSGFLNVANNVVNLVATTFEFADDIDLSRAISAKERAEKTLAAKEDQEKIRLAEMKLKRALVRINAAEQK